MRFINGSGRAVRGLRFGASTDNLRGHMSTKLWRLLLVITAVGSSGCGRPATVEECEEIVARIATLELDARKVPIEDRAEEIARLKESVRASTMKDCVGNRITEGAMQCVRQAPTPKDVTSCFD